MKRLEEIIRRERIIRKEAENKIIKERIAKIRKNKEIIIKRKMRENIKGVKYMNLPEKLFKIKIDNEL